MAATKVLDLTGLSHLIPKLKVTEVVTNTATGKTNTATTEGSVYLNLIQNDAIASSHKITGSGGTTVTADASGNITVKTDISGKQDTISASNKIPYSYISDTPTIPTIPNLAKGTTSGTGNAVTDISVSGHTVTLTKGASFVKTVNSTAPDANGNVSITIPSIPSLSKGTTTGSGAVVTDVSVSGHTVTLTKGDVLPTQTGNSGKFLKTDGTAASWAAVDALPAQTGNSGKVLTTNGTAASWMTPTWIPQTGARGSLAGYATPTVNATASIAITKDSADDIVATHASPAISVANGAAGQVWLKVVSITHAEAILTFGNQWLLPNDEIPALADNCVMTLYWNGTYGVVSMTYGSESGEGTGAAAKWLAITGGQMEGNITFKNGSQYSIGTASSKLKSLYVDELYLSQNSLYLGDTKVLGTDSSTIVVKTDVGQDLKLQTSGADDDISVVTQGAGADISFTAGGAGSKISFNASSVDFTTAANSAVTMDKLSVTGSASIANLTVTGTTTTVNATDLAVKDNLIVLNNGETGAGVSKGTAGLEIHRGTAARYRLIFDESDDSLKGGIVDSNGNNTTLKKVLFEGDDIGSVGDADLGSAPTASADPSKGTATVNVTNVYNELKLLAYYSGASAGNNTVAGDKDKEVRIVAQSAPDAVNSSGQNSKWDTAGLYLYGSTLKKVDGTSDTGNAGTFKLQTVYNSSNVQHSLVGTPAGNLSWTGSVQAQDYVMTSDRRMKENLVEIDSCLEKVDALTPYTFNFINDEEKVRKAGVIAQDVEKVLPEAVSEEDGVKRVSYDSLIPLLIGAIKELKTENEELRKMIQK